MEKMSDGIRGERQCVSLVVRASKTGRLTVLGHLSPSFIRNSVHGQLNDRGSGVKVRPWLFFCHSEDDQVVFPASANAFDSCLRTDNVL